MAVWQEVVRTAHQILADTYNVTLIDTYSWTVPLHWAHISLVGGGWDCLHYCRWVVFVSHLCGICRSGLSKQYIRYTVCSAHIAQMATLIQHCGLHNYTTLEQQSRSVYTNESQLAGGPC